MAGKRFHLRRVRLEGERLDSVFNEGYEEVTEIAFGLSIDCPKSNPRG